MDDHFARIAGRALGLERPVRAATPSRYTRAQATPTPVAGLEEIEVEREIDAAATSSPRPHPGITSSRREVIDQNRFQGTAEHVTPTFQAPSVRGPAAPIEDPFAVAAIAADQSRGDLAIVHRTAFAPDDTQGPVRPLEEPLTRPDTEPEGHRLPRQVEQAVPLAALIPLDQFSLSQMTHFSPRPATSPAAELVTVRAASREDRRAAREQGHAAPPSSIEVTIGRIDVRVVTTPLPMPKQTVAPPAAGVTLNEYLRERRAGAR